MEKKNTCLDKIFVKNNLLSEEEFDKLFFILTNQEFPWYHIKSATDETIKVKDKKFSPSSVLRHGFFVGKQNNSEMTAFLYPLLDSICSFVNSKEIIVQNLYCNLLLANESGVGLHNYPHIDAEYNKETLEVYKPYTGIFYLNETNGETLFFKKEQDSTLYVEDFRVQSEKNKFAYWSYDTYHSAPVSASEDRYVININFLIPR